MSQINRKEKEEKKCFVFALKRALLMLTDREKTRPSEDNCGEKKTNKINVVVMEERTFQHFLCNKI